MNFAAYDFMTNATKQVVVGNEIVYKPSIKIWVKGLDGIDATQGKVKQGLRELCSPAD